jgi:hypothetical protein
MRDAACHVGTILHMHASPATSAPVDSATFHACMLACLFIMSCRPAYVRPSVRPSGGGQESVQTWPPQNPTTGRVPPNVLSPLTARCALVDRISLFLSISSRKITYLHCSSILLHVGFLVYHSLIFFGKTSSTHSSMKSTLYESTLETKIGRISIIFHIFSLRVRSIFYTDVKGFFVRFAWRHVCACMWSRSEWQPLQFWRTFSCPPLGRKHPRATLHGVPSKLSPVSLPDTATVQPPTPTKPTQFHMHGTATRFILPTKLN